MPIDYLRFDRSHEAICDEIEKDKGVPNFLNAYLSDPDENVQDKLTGFYHLLKSAPTRTLLMI